MVLCKHCKKNTQTVSPDGILICCGLCGRVIHSDCYTSEPTFVKNSTGQSQMAGNFVRSVQNAFSASRERIFNRTRLDMDYMMTALDLGGGDFIINQALRFYTIAYERNFTRGRRIEQVEAACLYIACRENKKPYLLIDFSEYLKVNVYILGAVFLQLCKLLCLQEHPIVQKPVDPSLFIHRYTKGLRGADMAVTKTALRIMASMKRDWMQTGRKPSGLCGAALYVSALSHGLNCSKLEIIKIVHVCEATLTKRLIEFENTESGGLTIEEFNMKADELESISSRPAHTGSIVSGICELLCVHKDSGMPPSPFAHGLCESCYVDFMNLSGGLDGGSNPPAFQRAERERMLKSTAEENASESNLNVPDPNQNNDGLNKLPGNEVNIPNPCGSKTPQFEGPESNEFREPAGGDDVPRDEPHDDVGGENGVSCDESESFSDIDDAGVEEYIIRNEVERRYKRIIWEEVNREFLEEQAAKEAAAAAAKEALEANFRDRPEEFKAAQELAAAAAAAVSKSKKERQQKRAAEAKNSGPSQSATEATWKMLAKKRQSSRINYGALDNLFEETDGGDNSKKAKVGEEEKVESDGREGEEYKDDGYGEGDYFDENAGEEYGYGYEDVDVGDVGY